MRRSGRPDPILRHHRVILDAVLAPDAELEQRYLRWWAAFDPDAPVDAGTYRLLPLLWTRVRDLQAASTFEGRLRGIYRHAWVENQQVLAGARSGLAALADAAIPAMLLKGAALVQHEYAELGARPMRDLDVLVPSDDRERAVAALLDSGWNARYGYRAGQRRILGRETLTRSEGGPDLDLHWRAPGDLAQEIADGWLWHDARPAQLLGVPCLRPAPTQHLAVTLAHGLRGNPEPPIRWVVDAARIIACATEGVDWDGLVVAAERARLRTRVGIGLGVLEGFGTVAVPAPVRRALARDTVLERWEYRVKAVSPQHANQVTSRLATYWAGRREERLFPVAAGLTPYAVAWVGQHVRTAGRSVRSTLGSRPS